MNRKVVVVTGATCAAVLFLHLGAYAWFWQERLAEGSWWTAAYNRIGQYFLLGWVEKYQTLLGALIAAAAAVSIILNTLVERAHRREDDRLERIGQVSDAIKVTAFSLRGLAVLVLRGGLSMSDFDRQLDAIMDQCRSYVSEAKSLCNTLIYCLEAMRLEYAQIIAADGKDEGAERMCIAYAKLMAIYLDDPQHFFHGGSFRLSKVKLTEEDKAKFNLEGMRAHDADFIKMLFDIDDAVATG